MNPYPLFDCVANTKRTHPVQSYQAAERLNLSKSCLFALRTFERYQGYTHGGLAETIGYKAADRACKRAFDLCDGLADRTGDERYRGLVTRELDRHGEFMNFTTEKGSKVLEEAKLYGI